MKEADITRQIRDLLRALGIFHFKHWGGPMSPKGLPDIMGCYDGRFFGIEVKAPGKKPTEAQSNVLWNIRKAGGISFVARSVEDVVKKLKLKVEVM